MKAPIVFVDPEGIQSPTRFVAELREVCAARGFAIESDPARLDRHPVILTTLGASVADALHQTNVEYTLLVTPQEDFSGLDAQLLERARRVVALGDNPFLPLPLGQDRTLRLAGRWPREAPLPERVPLAEDDADEAHLLFPYSYLDHWERFVADGTVPSSIRVVTDRHHLPPSWFEAKARAFGGRVRTVFFTERALDAPGLYLRDNPDLDALDLALLNARVRMKNVRSGRDPRDAARAEDAVAWSRLLDAATTADGAPLFTAAEPARPANGPQKINVVCYNPTYLFTDLVNRFEKVGCVHSELPLPDADGYVWMRPQELAAFVDVGRGTPPVDVPPSWQKKLADAEGRYGRDDAERIATRSVAIHHGTCAPPIVQFDPFHLAKRLATVWRVAGVCELAECYGPSKSIANPDNFEFVPIGYDHTLFTERLIRSEPHAAGSTLRIGFVGRAYGTNDRAQLAKSKYSHPKGYRKGGDHLVNVLLRLRARNVPFEVQVVGKNWEETIAECESLGLPVSYYARDENIQYDQYPGVFASFDVLLITARCEGGPVAAIEAMSVGVPVVGTNVGIIPFLAKTTPHCTAVEYDTKWQQMDHAAATEALIEIGARDFTREERLVVRRSVEQYTTDAWVARLRALAAEASVGTHARR